MSKLVHGYGINDIVGCCTKGAPDYYKYWQRMLERCFNDNLKKKHPTYVDVVCCESWIYLSNFKVWFENKRALGWWQPQFHLDKDIIKMGNKEYAPDVCCFVPAQANVLFTKCTKVGSIPIGVYEAAAGYYQSFCSIDGKQVYGSHKDPFTAHRAWQELKVSAILRCVDNHRNVLEPLAIEGLLFRVDMLKSDLKNFTETTQL